MQGYLAHKKTLTLLGTPKDPRHRRTVRSQGAAFFYGRGTPVQHLRMDCTGEHGGVVAPSCINKGSTFCSLREIVQPRLHALTARFLWSLELIIPTVFQPTGQPLSSRVTLEEFFKGTSSVVGR